MTTQSWLDFRLQALLDLESFENFDRIAAQLSRRIDVAILLRLHSRFDVGHEIVLPQRAPEKRR